MLSPVELLAEHHATELFDCGKPVLNNWLKAYALTNQRHGFTRVLVVTEGNNIAGYYGLAPGAIASTSAPRSIRTGRPPDPIPCLLLGQLAVDQSQKGKGIGSYLVRDAFRRCLAAADFIGGRAIVVRSVDAEAEAYWLSWGFIPSRDNPSVLFRQLADIRLTLQEIDGASSG